MLSVLTLADRDAYAHAYRVAALSASVAAHARLARGGHGLARTRARCCTTSASSPMPDAVLRKPAPLTIEEQMLDPPAPADRQRADRAACRTSRPRRTIVRDAHERIDGLGYPARQFAPRTSRSARASCRVADAFDTMTRPRVFRDAIGPPDALLELERCAGTQFDPAVVAAFRA